MRDRPCTSCTRWESTTEEETSTLLGTRGAGKAKGNVRQFPMAEMVAISLALVCQAYVVSSLFPYVGFLVQDLLQLSSRNAAGECMSVVVSRTFALVCCSF